MKNFLFTILVLLFAVTANAQINGIYFDGKDYGISGTVQQSIAINGDNKNHTFSLADWDIFNANANDIDFTASNYIRLTASHIVLANLPKVAESEVDYKLGIKNGELVIIEKTQPLRPDNSWIIIYRLPNGSRFQVIVNGDNYLQAVGNFLANQSSNDIEVQAICRRSYTACEMILTGEK